MAADIGKVALSLELSLSAEPAIKTLDTIYAKFTSIEKKAASIVKALDRLQAPDLTGAVPKGMAEEAVAEAAELEKLTGPEAFAKVAQDIGESIQAVAKDLRIFGKLSPEVQQKFLSLISAFGTFKPAELEQLSHLLGEDLSKAFEKVYAHKEEVVGLLDETRQSMYALSGIGKVFIKDVEGISSSIGNMVKGLNPLVALLPALLGAVKQLSNEMDEFSRGNYRASGSSIQLSSHMRELQSDLYLTGQEAMESGKAIYFSGIRAHDGQMEVMKTVAKLTRAYGVNAVAVANYAAQMILAGKDSKETSAHIDHMSKVLRVAGLNAGEATALFNKLAKSAFGMTAVFGAGAAESFSQAMVAATALARGAKVPLDDINDIMAKIETRELGLLRLQGVDMDVLKSADSMEVLAASMESVIPKFEKLQASGKHLFVKEAQMKGMTTFTMRQGLAMTSLVKEMNRLGIAGDTLADRLRNYYDAQKKEADLNEAFAETFRTLSQVLKKALIPIMSALTTIIDPLARAIVWLLEPLGVIGDILSPVVKWFSSLSAEWQTASKIAGGLVLAIIAIKMSAASLFAGIVAVSLVFRAAKHFWDQNTVASKALGVALGAVATIIAVRMIPGLRGLASGLGGIAKGAGRAIGGMGRMGKVFSKTADTASKANSKMNPRAGMGFRVFMKNLAAGLKSFGPAALKGAFFFALSITLMAAPLILFGLIIKKFGLGVKDLALAAGVFLAAMIVFQVASKIIAASAAAIAPFQAVIWPLIAVLAALAVVLIAVSFASTLFAKAIAIVINAVAGFIDVLGDNMEKIGAGMINMGTGLLMVAAAGLAMIPAIPGLAGAVGAIIALSAAIWTFPNKDFSRFTNDLVRLSEALPKLQGLAYTVHMLDSLEDVMDDMEDINLDPLIRLAGVGPHLFMAASSLFVLAHAINSIGMTVDRVKGVDLYEILAGRILSNENKFIRAAEIVSDYAESIAASMDKVHDVKNIDMFNLPKTLEILENPVEAKPVAASAAGRTRLTSREQRDKANDLLSKQNAILASLLQETQKDDGDSGQIVEKLQELIDAQRRGASTNRASQWQ